MNRGYSEAGKKWTRAQRKSREFWISVGFYAKALLGLIFVVIFVIGLIWLIEVCKSPFKIKALENKIQVLEKEVENLKDKK
jgi:cell division protein FtsB